MIWNHVQQDSRNVTAFFPTDVNLVLEQSTKAARSSPGYGAMESALVDDFAELLPSGD
jgi:hypothetical protein